MHKLTLLRRHSFSMSGSEKRFECAQGSKKCGHMPSKFDDPLYAKVCALDGLVLALEDSAALADKLHGHSAVRDWVLVDLTCQTISYKPVWAGAGLSRQRGARPQSSRECAALALFGVP